MRRVMGVTAIVAVLGLCLPATGIVLNQVDDFENNTTMSWGGGASPTNILNGGPTGAGDNFLRISRTSEGNLGTSNASQWTGDYLTAGVGAIRADINHLAGTTPVELRIMIFGSNGDVWASTNPTLIAAGWNTYTFGLGASDLVQVLGSSALADTLGDVTNLLIRHDNGDLPTPPGFGPPAIVATLGLDNIRAVVPEPASMMLLNLGGLAILCRRST